MGVTCFIPPSYIHFRPLIYSYFGLLAFPHAVFTSSSLPSACLGLLAFNMLLPQGDFPDLSNPKPGQVTSLVSLAPLFLSLRCNTEQAPCLLD
jgi:hypothetical protein